MQQTEFKLEEPLKRGITSALGYVEELLSTIGFALSNTKGIFVEVTNNFNNANILQIENIIKDMLQSIKEIKEKLHLEKQEIKGSNIISSRCGAIWETLCDIESKKLKKYGQVDKNFSEYFDPIIKKLLDQNEKIFNILKH
jgi:hypothetical protein